MTRDLSAESELMHWLKLGMASALISFGLSACGEGEQTAQEPTAEDSTAVTETAPNVEDSAAPTTDTAMGDMEGMDHSAMDHDEHAMTPAQFAELRQKILLYRDMPDEGIMESMNRMPPDFHKVLSSESFQGDVGLLALGHGYTLGGNEQFETYVNTFAGIFPTAIAPGMAMMSSSHIQSAVDELTQKHGVKTIVVVPMEPGDDSSLNRQWKYIFGLIDEAPYLSVPRVKTEAKVVMSGSPAKDPIMANIMMDYAMELSEQPDRDRVIIVSHGPEDPKDNPEELALLESHAEIIRQDSQLKDIKVLSMQDDAPPPIRAGHVEELRAWIKEATDEGRRVIIVPFLLTKGGFHARLAKDIEGLEYTMAQKGLIEHPAFQDWIGAEIRMALEE